MHWIYSDIRSELLRILAKLNNKKRGTLRKSSCRASKNGLNVSLYTFNPFVYLTFFIDFVKFRRIIIRIGNAIQKIRPNFKGSIVIDGLA